MTEPLMIPTAHVAALLSARQRPESHWLEVARWERRRWWTRMLWDAMLLAAVLALAAVAIYAAGAWLGG